MIIQKVINNNVVSTFDSNGKEVILMGKGIGFRKKTGDELDKTKIEKIFTLEWQIIFCTGSDGDHSGVL